MEIDGSEDTTGIPAPFRGWRDAVLVACSTSDTLRHFSYHLDATVALSNQTERGCNV